MATDFPYLIVWPKQLLGDDKIDLMTAEEFGGFWRLCLIAWQQDPTASLPPDEDRLARWAKLDTARWRACRRSILDCFVMGRDGRLYQMWLRGYYEDLVRKHEKFSAAGRKGGRPKKARLSEGFQKSKALEKGSVAVDGFVASEGKEGGPGETIGNHPSAPAARLASLWAFHYTGCHIGQRMERELVGEFEDLLKLAPEAEIEASIVAKERTRSELLWQFKKRWVVKKSQTESRAERVRREYLEQQCLKDGSKNGQAGTDRSSA